MQVPKRLFYTDVQRAALTAAGTRSGWQVPNMTHADRELLMGHGIPEARRFPKRTCCDSLLQVQQHSHGWMHVLHCYMSRIVYMLVVACHAGQGFTPITLVVCAHRTRSRSFSIITCPRSSGVCVARPLSRPGPARPAHRAQVSARAQRRLALMSPESSSLGHLASNASCGR